MTFLFHPQAQAELRDAVEYYEGMRRLRIQLHGRDRA